MNLSVCKLFFFIIQLNKCEINKQRDYKDVNNYAPRRNSGTN